MKITKSPEVVRADAVDVEEARIEDAIDACEHECERSAREIVLTQEIARLWVALKEMQDEKRR